MSESISVGITETKDKVQLNPAMANRHGLIAGATGTGKTVTLQVLAEQFSNLGASVFLTDIKGDLSGISKPAVASDKLKARLDKFPGVEFLPSGNPVNFMDMLGERGHPLRVTPSSLGPLLLSRMLELNETQEGVLHIAFKYADEEGLLLLDLKDLKALLSSMSDHAEEIRKEYGNVSPASIGAIQRRLLVIEEQGGDSFFGEPEFEVRDLLMKDFSGKGLINILDATKLLQQPRLYGSILLWLLSEIYESLEEVGDQPVPKLIFFFDEAHLLFDDLSKALLDKLETVVRLVRSKGVGVFFVTQISDDIPDRILAQLGNRVQHALRSYTAADADRIKKIARTFRVGKNINIEEVLTTLEVGEALVSPLSEKGEPMEVVRAMIKPPMSQIGPISDVERKDFFQRSQFFSKYSKSVDRESAFEILKKRIVEGGEVKGEEIEEKPVSKSKRQGPFEAFFISLARSIGSQVGHQVLRGVLGTMTKKR